MRGILLAEYCGFYDDANRWREVVDGVSGSYDRRGNFAQGPPWVLDPYWNEITNERTDQNYGEEAENDEESEAWEEWEKQRKNGLSRANLGSSRQSLPPPTGRRA